MLPYHKIYGCFFFHYLVNFTMKAVAFRCLLFSEKFEKFFHRGLSWSDLLCLDFNRNIFWYLVHTGVFLSERRIFFRCYYLGDTIFHLHHWASRPFLKSGMFRFFLKKELNRVQSDIIFIDVLANTLSFYLLQFFRKDYVFLSKSVKYLLRYSKLMRRRKWMRSSGVNKKIKWVRRVKKKIKWVRRLKMWLRAKKAVSCTIYLDRETFYPIIKSHEP